MRLLCQLQRAQVGNDFMKNNLPGELIINKLSFFKHSIILYILKPESEFLSFYFYVHVSVCARAHVSCTCGGQSSPSALCLFVVRSVCAQAGWPSSLGLSISASRLATAALGLPLDMTAPSSAWYGGLKSGPHACTKNPCLAETCSQLRGTFKQSINNILR